MCNMCCTDVQLFGIYSPLIENTMQRIIAVSLIALASGCAAVPPEKMPITTEKREFTYEYSVPGRSKSDIFKAARNYMALAYGDSKHVLRSEDESDGTLIGKAVVPWNLTTDIPMYPYLACGSNFEVIFIAKEGRARMQLTLLEGSAMPSTCGGWTLPPKRDYPQIVEKFNATSLKLEESLNGTSKLESLKNF